MASTAWGSSSPIRISATSKARPPRVPPRSSGRQEFLSQRLPTLDSYRGHGRPHLQGHERCLRAEGGGVAADGAGRLLLPDAPVEPGLLEMLTHRQGGCGGSQGGKSGREGSVRKHARIPRDVCTLYHQPFAAGSSASGSRSVLIGERVPGSAAALPSARDQRLRDLL